MRYKHLLAKKADDPDHPAPEQTLLGHSKKVIQAAEILNDLLGQEIQKFIGSSLDQDSWRKCSLLAAWLHDLGKANDHFQAMIRGGQRQQGVRHETLGVVVIHELLEPWLQEFWRCFPAWLQGAVYFAIAGHHLKFPDRQQRTGAEVIFLGGHPELRSYLDLGRDLLQLSPPPELSDRRYSLLALGDLGAILSRLQRQLLQDFDEKQKLVIAALKVFLLNADLAGSVLPERNQDLDSWLAARLRAALASQALENLVVKKIKGSPSRPFQRAVAEATSPTVLVQAGCGSGKTVAAYLWAARQAAGRRLFFCYPTTTTASEGFSGYWHEPELDALLIHSRAEVDYRLLDNMPAPTATEQELRILKLEALDTWSVPAVVCTAHTVFGLLQNFRRGLYAWPALIQAVFVFDEIHSFSPRLFQHLLRFLTVFKNSPVLLMTASLLPAQLRALRQVCQERGGLLTIGGPPERETALRYKLQLVDEEAAWRAVRETLAQKGKVLWIVNTVARCVDVAARAAAAGLPVQPFHSRYRYRDRLQRQRQVISGFAPNKPAMLAITTQVAEISLDISADLLVSELAPVPSLIQRLGRLNRFEDIPVSPKPALLVHPPDIRPYSPEEFLEEALTRWLELVADGQPKSQADLTLSFAEVYPEEAETWEQPVPCDWLDDPWNSLSGRHALQEPGYTLEVVREEDLQSGSLVEMAIPMPLPRGLAWQTWRFQGRFAIAPAGTIQYDPFWGGSYGEQAAGFTVI